MIVSTLQFEKHQFRINLPLDKSFFSQAHLIETYKFSARRTMENIVCSGYILGYLEWSFMDSLEARQMEQKWRITA